MVYTRARYIASYIEGLIIGEFKLSPTIKDRVNSKITQSLVRYLFGEYN
jgi:hypothetical protein